MSLELTNIFKESAGKTKTISKRTKDAISLVSMSDLYGYKPGMSRIYGLFSQNPFGAYAFIARHHPVVRACIQVILDEVANDGFSLVAEKGVTKKRLKEVYRKIKELELPELRLSLCKQLRLYGNAWILPHTNLLGGKSDNMQLLSPPKLLPDIDPVTDKVRGWLYKPGPGIGTIPLPVDKVWHLRTFSADDYRPIGDPPLGPAMLRIEADMAATAFNNQVFQKAGLMGIIVSVEAPEDDDPFDDASLDAVDDLQERLDTQFSGAKAGQSTIVASNIKDVYNVNPVGKLDSSFKTLSYETAKTIATCLGVPPERIAVSRSETLQYIPSLVEDSVNTAFDKALNHLVSYVDEFINEKIIKGRLGITDVRIQAGGRYGALTKNAAETIKALAEAGPIITVNDALDKVLGWEPLPPDNPRGQKVLDNTATRKPETIPLTSDPIEEDFNLGKTAFMKKYRFEAPLFMMKDKTRSKNDEVIVHRAIINKWGVKYYEECFDDE